MSDDITSLKRIIETLKKENTQLKSLISSTKNTSKHDTECEIIFNNTQSAIMLIDKNSKIKKHNYQLAKLFGYSKNEDLVGVNVKNFHNDQESYIKFKSEFIPKILKYNEVKIEWEFINKNGGKFWARANITCINDNSNTDSGNEMVWVIEDITENKKTQVELLEAYSELKTIYDNSIIGILIVGKDRVITKVNHTGLKIMGYDSEDEVIGKSIRIMHLSDEKCEEFGKTYYQSLINRNSLEVDVEVMKKDGSPIWIANSGKAIDTNIPPDLSKGVIWAFRDITTRKNMEKQLTELARTDELTGIMNRRYFTEQANFELAIHNRYKRPISLLMLDLDHFKKINDTYGHSTGDRVLQYFVKVCQSVLCETDIFARIGGEEFCILLPETNQTTAIHVAEKIRLATEDSTSDKNIPPVKTSIGVYTAEPADDLETMIKKADRLLYKAKESGRNQIHYKILTTI